MQLRLPPVQEELRSQVDLDSRFPMGSPTLAGQPNASLFGFVYGLTYEQLRSTYTGSTFNKRK